MERGNVRLLSARAFLLCVLVLFPSSAWAALIAFMESPEAGPVAGVQIVRGWAFATESGETITRVDLVVDGEPVLAIPCCGARADVAAAYPQYPSSVTLQSGWGLTLNWSLLPPGSHIVQVEIATNRGALWTSEPRTVEVGQLGGFEFVDQLTLADAAARLDGDEVVLDSVRVRDQASGQEQALTLRLRWDSAAQSLVVSGAVTTATITSFRSTLWGLLNPVWTWLASTTSTGAVQAVTGIQAHWESPTEGQVAAGIGVLRGWMFAEEPGVPITRVQVLLDGVAVTTMPCCSARGDVAAAFPDNPNALQSGAGLVLNYGELRAGPHTLGLEIEAANGAALVLSRTILVLKPGGFAFLELFYLVDANVRIADEELILENVRIREQASQLERTVSLRFRWDVSSQSFILAANDPPVAHDQSVQTNIDQPVSLSLIATDADGDPVRYEVVEPPSHGVLVGAPPNVIYAPAGGFTGQDSFTFRAHDFVSPSNVATVTITVESTPTSAPPAVDLDPANTAGQRPNFIATFTEDDGPVLIVSPVMTVADPDSAMLASATLTLTNLLNAGQEVLAVDPATVDPNTPIIATYNALSGVLSLSGSASVAAYQAALRTLTYDNVSQNPDPTSRIITVIASDGAAVSAPVTSTVNVRPVNDQPTFTASDPPAVGENAGPQTLPGWATFDPGAPEEAGQTVLAYTVSAVGNPNLFATPPAVAINGTLTYTPANSTVGTATFTVTVQDNGGTANGGVDTSAPQTFTITVTAVDDPPVAVDDAATVTEDDPATTIDVLGNDTDTDGGPISIASVTQSANGAVVITNGGADLTYQPDPDYCNAPPGTMLDTFTYTLTPGGSTATVSVTVTCVNDVPVVDLNGPAAGVDFAATFTEGTPAVIVDAGQLTVTDLDSANLATATITLTNLQDVGLETLTAFTMGTTITANYAEPVLTLTGADTVAHYQQVLRTVTYNNTAPNPNTTARLIEFIVNDGTVDSATATSTVTVQAINSAPSFTKGADQTVLEDAGAQTVNPWATGISDGDGNIQTLTFNITGNTNAGLFSAGPAISATGVLTYTPAANANGSATITITLSDNGGTANGGVDTSAPQTFTITVNDVNDAPSFTSGGNQTVNEDAGPQTVNPWATAISPGATNEAGQTLMFSITNNTNAALFSAGPNISAAGVLTYTPVANASGSATITVRLMDDGGTVNSGQDTTTQTFTITVNDVNDAPSFTSGGNQTVNEDAGPQTVNPWATAISAGPVSESGQTLTFSITGNTNAALFSAGPSINTAGVLTYTPAANAFGSATITVVLIDNGGTANGGVDTTTPQTFTITVNPVNDPPVAEAKLHITHSGIGLTINAASHTGELKENATDVDDPFNELTVELVGAPTPANATIVLIDASDGSFYFEPPGGLSGNSSASFQFRVCDDGDVGLGLAAACSTPVTATFDITGPDLWFVDDTDAAGCGVTCNGSRTKPLTGLNNAALTGRGTNDRIFVFSGTYVAGFALNSDERLIGQGASGSFDTVLGVTMPSNGTLDTRPTLGGARPTLQNTVTVNTNGVVQGLNVSTTNNTALTDPAGATTGVTVNEVNVSATTATAVSFNDLSGTVTLGSTTSTGGVTNVSLTNVAATVNLGSGALSGSSAGASNHAFLVSGGAGDVTYSGSITKATQGNVVNISGRTGGTITLSGTINGNSSNGINVSNNTSGLPVISFTGASKTLNTGANAAVTLDNNDNATLNFSGGGLVITTTSGAGFTAINGATAINISGAGNTITSTTGAALNVNNSTIGGLGLTFQSISSNGGSNTGIILDTTGVLGGLTVTGAGSAGSGGTIANKTGADGSTTTGTGVYLNNTSNVSLAWMQLNDFDNSAIAGRSVNGFILTDSVISGTIGDNSAPVEGPINFGVTNPGGTNGLQGAGLIRNTKISGGIEHNLEFYNQSGSMNLTIDGVSAVSEGADLNSPADDVADCIIEENTVASGSDGILIEMQNTATATIVVDRCLFRDNKSQAVQIAAIDNSAITATIDECRTRRFDQGNEGFILSNGSNASLTAMISNNHVNNYGGTGIFVGQTPGNATSSSVLHASILNNTVNQPTTATNHGILAFLTSTVGQLSQARVRIDGNNVTNNSTSGTTRGILVDTPDASTSPMFDATVTNNTVSVGDNVAGVAGLVVQARQSSDLCANINGNTVTFPNGTPGGVFGLRARQVDPGAYDLEQSAGCTGTAAAVLACRNPGSTTEVLGTISVVSSGSCLLPNTP